MAPILSSSHRSEALDALLAAMHKFVTIPEDKRLSCLDNERLLRPITEAEVLLAVQELSRHKSAGQDGPYNDFYRNTSALMLPALVIISNQILDGVDLPPSFLKALIIPLCKKGDSADAMDY